MTTTRSGGRGLFTSNAHLSDEAIALCVDALRLGQTSQLPEEITAHVAECLTCKVQILELSELLPEDHYTGIGTHPFLVKEPATRWRITARAYRVAAAIVITLGATLLGYYVMVQKNSRDNSARDHIAASDTTIMEREKPGPPASPARGYLAENFVPSSNLEDYLTAQYRSASVDIVSPLPGDTVKDRIIFSWAKVGSRRSVIKVLSNKERTVYSASTSTQRHVVTLHLVPGLYYWKLEEDDELLYVGKFFVR